MVDDDLRALVNGVIWPSFEGRELPEWMVEELQHGLAGVFFFGLNLDLDDPSQLTALSDQVHSLRPDALTGSDEEGGIVTRIESGQGSQVPGNAVLGRLDDLELTRAANAHIGSYLSLIHI